MAGLDPGNRGTAGGWKGVAATLELVAGTWPFLIWSTVGMNTDINFG